MSETWFEQFQRDGFTVFEDFLTSTEVENLKKGCAQIIDKFNADEHRSIFNGTSSGQQQPNYRDVYFMESGDKVRCFYEQKAVDAEGNLLVDKHLAINKIGHALHKYVPEFVEVTFSEKVKAIIQKLQFVKPTVMQSMYIFKQPKIGGEVGAHQDATYLSCEPFRLVGLWFALEDTTTENGCLHFIPQSHRNGLHGNYRWTWKAKDQLERQFEGELPSYSPEQFVPVAVRKGSMVLFDGLAVHRSSENTSPASRHAYTVHIYDGACKWSEECWLQPTSAGTFMPLFDTQSTITCGSN